MSNEKRVQKQSFDERLDFRTAMRSGVLASIASDASDVAEMFCDLRDLVDNQHESVQSISTQVDNTRLMSIEAQNHIDKAASHQMGTICSVM